MTCVYIYWIFLGKHSNCALTYDRGLLFSGYADLPVDLSFSRCLIDPE